MKKILTIILDGFGIREEEHGNAIKKAQLPNFNNFYNKNPHTLLHASEEYVGLPKGTFGNSEVGHMAIGAGRLIKHQSLLINELFKSGKIEQNQEFIKMIEYIKKNNSSLHLMGIASNGGVHGDITYFLEMLKLVKKHDIKNVYLHLITDGRDTSPISAPTFIKYINEVIEYVGIGSIASVCGRYYAMDRDNKWDRTKNYYNLVVYGLGHQTDNLTDTIKTAYSKDITDEFIPPIICNQEGVIKENDCIFWLNYRADRSRQIMMSLTNEKFDEFSSKKINLKAFSFYKINELVNTSYLLEDNIIENSLGRYLSSLDITQARIAETEKYAHVTRFFDGFYEGQIEKCDKFLIPSSKVATYDLMPEMGAVAVTKKTIECIENDYDFILVNLANPDMVGHTGNMNATIKALETVDECLGLLIEAATDNFYKIIVLSDHGNADTMLDENNNPVTTHSLAKVPFIISDQKVKLKEGDLTMVAPTILKYLDIKIPDEMKGTPTLFVDE